MIATLKSELRKLLSVRSTYVMLILALIIIGIMAFWVEGYKGISGSPASLGSTFAFNEIIMNAGIMASAFGGIVAILFMVHEYRYNTIMYTLTISNSRTKVLLAKVLTMVAYATAFTLICVAFGLIAYRLGLLARGSVTLQSQDIAYASLGGKLLFYNIGQILLALLVATITRNIAASIAVIFLAPATVEPLLGLLLKENAVYLPFAAFEKVLASPNTQSLVQGDLTAGRAAAVVSAYLVIGWLVTWQLFLRRDAN